MLRRSVLLGTVAVSNNRAVRLELLCNQVGGVGGDVNTRHGHPTAQTASRFIVGRGEAAAVWFSGKRLPLLRRCRMFFFFSLFCLPLLMPIYYSRRALARRTEEGAAAGGGSRGGEKPEWRYCEGGQGGFCSSPAASLLITLRTNMKHTHATASSHTHLTSIRHTDGEPIL